MVDFDHFGSTLVRAFPSCVEIARANSIDLDGPDRDGAYIIFTCLQRYLECCVEVGDVAETLRVMDFIEGLANEDDPKWPELIQIEFGEWVHSYSEKLRLEHLAGPETRKAMWNAERYFMRAQRHQEASPLLSYLRKLFVARKKR